MTLIWLYEDATRKPVTTIRGSRMTEINPVNITIESPAAVLLTQLADRERKSISTLASELLLEAIELREDMLLSKIADDLDIEGAQMISHDEAWKRVLK
jgi:hypothetical protein